MSDHVIKSNLSFRKQHKLSEVAGPDFYKCGWLRKQGGTFKTMKRRYFVLVKEVLYYYTNNTKSTLKGQINLRNLELSELEEDRGSGEYSFSILPELGKDCVNGSHERFQLLSNDKKDAELWMQHIKQNMYLRRDGGLFGTSLSTVRKYLKQEYSYVPRVVFECCKRIREIGMEEEGIFRKNGQQSLVFHMKANIDRANYNWKDVDIHTICSLLKLYLRELPEPLIPFSHYDSLKAVGYRIEVGEDLDLVRDKLSVLPPPNLQLLKYLCEFLLEVSTHHKNRMEISSLAKVFSPNILRDKDTDPYIEESSSSLISITVAALIKSQKDLFIFDYQPLDNDDGDNVADDSKYSVSSLFSNVSFVAACLNFDDNDRSDVSVPQQNYKPNRVQSMAFTSYPLVSNLIDSSNLSQSTDNVERISHCTRNRDHTALVKSANNDLIKSASKPENGEQLLNVCERCRCLESELMEVTEDRDRLRLLYDLKSETCKQLEKDIEDLQLQLSETTKSKTENANDLSEVLAYFKMNR